MGYNTAMIVKKRVIWYSLSSVVLLATSVVMLFVSKGFYYDFETGAIKKNGAVYVRSIPRDSHIYINNKLKKKKTPISISLPEASYEMRVEKEGYIPWKKNISIKEGYVSWENYIFLILEKREKTNITESGIKTYLVAPSKNKIAYLDSNNNVWFVNPNDNKHTKIYSSKDELTFLSWNRDSNTLLAKDKKDYFLVTEKNTQKIKHVPGKLVKIEISESDSKDVYALSNNYLYKASEENILIQEQGIETFSQTKNNLFYAKNTKNGSEIWKSNFSFSDKNKILTDKQSITMILPNEKEAYAYTTTNKNLYLYKNGETEKLYDNVTFGKWSGDDKKLLYGTEQELRVYIEETDNPFEKRNRVINRLSVKIDSCIWFYDYNHVIYKTGDNIIFIGIDGTNSVTLQEKTNSKLNNFETTKYGRDLIFSEKENNLINIKIMKIGEENGLIPY